MSAVDLAAAEAAAITRAWRTRRQRRSAALAAGRPVNDAQVEALEEERYDRQLLGWSSPAGLDALLGVRR